MELQSIFLASVDVKGKRKRRDGSGF